MTTLTPEFRQSIRRSVDQALDLAAEVTLPKFRQPIVVDNKDVDGFDPVTLADREAEQVLRDALTAALPYAQFLGEENSVAALELDPTLQLPLSQSDQASLTWVVDPIDGTRAFITGLPLWGTLVALNDGTEVVFGVLDQPWLAERFIGDGEHAELVHGGKSSVLKTRAERPISECILQCTTPDMFTDAISKQAFKRVQSKVAMTRYGGDCYAYALLAMGGIDAVIESSLQPYDIQALIPIVEGAGGVITNWDGDACLSGGSVVAAANAALHAQLLAVLNDQ